MITTEAMQRQYSRKYSELKGLQKEHSLTYRLEQHEDVWRMEIEEVGKTEVRKDALLLDCPVGIAENVLRFFYENAVSLDSWRDIVQDILPQYIIKDTVCLASAAG